MVRTQRADFTPSPLAGEGWGEGVPDWEAAPNQPPLPNPSPARGEGQYCARITLQGQPFASHTGRFAMPISLDKMPSITSSAPPPIDASRPSRYMRETLFSNV